jgi:DNA-binding beta-propeller fold protein YncE
MRRVCMLSVAGLAAVMVVGAAPGLSQSPQWASPSASRESPPLRLVQEIPLPGVEGRLDHFTIDPKRKRVIVSALGNNTVEIVDAFAGRRIHSISGLSDPQGTLYVAEFDRLYVANAGDGTVRVFDGTSYAPVASIEFGEDADNLRYDAAAKRVYVAYGDGAIGAIDPKTNARLDVNYKLEAHPEGFQLETKGPRIFVNLADKKSVAVIDRKTGKITTWQLGGGAANFPLTLDEAHQRVLVGTRKPARLVVFDMTSGKIVTSVPTAGDMDDLFYDSGRGRVYIPGGEGFISVFEQTEPDRYVAMDKAATSIGTRTGVFYAARDRVYLAAPPHANIGAALLVFEAQD